MAFAGLAAYGFQLGSYEYSAMSFGNGIVTFYRGDLFVAVTRDRSQYFATIGTTAGGAARSDYGLVRMVTGPDRGDPDADDRLPFGLVALADVFVSEWPSLEPYLVRDRVHDTFARAAELGRRLEFERYGRPLPSK